MPGLKLTLSKVTSSLPDNLSGLKRKYIQAYIMMKIVAKYLVFQLPEPKILTLGSEMK